MRAGIFLAYWPWFSPPEQLELAALADELALDSVWVSEAWGQDAVSVVGLLAGRTERIALASGLLQIPARQPTATAMAAVTLDVLSGGRFRLRRGVSGPQVSEGWYGVPFGRPVSRTREYVEIVRAALARRAPLVHEGREYAIPLPPERGTGPGKPLKLLAKPVQRPIHVYLGAVGPRAVELTDEVADGRLPFMVDPRQADVLFEPLDRGRAHARGPRRRRVRPHGRRSRSPCRAGRGAAVAGLRLRRDGRTGAQLPRRSRRARRARSRRALASGRVDVGRP